MRYITLLFAFIYSAAVSSQISMAHNYTGSIRYLTKLDHNGYVYYSVNGTAETIELFDVNTNALIKSMAVPNFATAILNEIHLSDNLFDTDQLVEFIVLRSYPGGIFDLEIYNELGTQVFFLANCSNIWPGNGTPLHIPELKNDHLVFFDGVSTKMQVFRFTSPGIGSFEVYDLPGSLPCIQCGQAGPNNTTGANNIKNSGSEISFFPNPVTGDNRLKLKYNIPLTTKMARIKVYDVNGKLLDDKRISAATDYIFLPSDYNNGLYMYSLEVDGQIIKNEKIVLDK